MLARLGPEAADAIDEFLNLALAYDREAAPSLQGFLDQLRARRHEIKRDMEQGRDEVRVMTVHGAKGLRGADRVPARYLHDRAAARPQALPLPSAGEPPDEVDHHRVAAGRALEARRARRQQGRG